MSDLTPAPEPDDGFMSEARLREAQEARKRRREEFVKTIEDAGLNPAEIDVTKVMSDEEQAEAIRQQAARKAAHELAKKVGSRQALRARFKQTVEMHAAATPDEPTKIPTAEELEQARKDREAEDEGTT